MHANAIQKLLFISIRDKFKKLQILPSVEMPIFQIFLKLLNLYNCCITWDPRIEIFEFLTPFAFSQLFVFLHLGSLCQVLTWHMYWKRMIELWEPFLTHAKAHELLLVPMIGLQPLDLSPKKQWNHDYISQIQLLFGNSISGI